MSSNRVLNEYFKEARTWADDQFGRIQVSRKRYQSAFFVAMGLNAISLLVIGILAHYQTLIPIMVHHYENGITTVEPLQQKLAPMNQTQVESDLVRYIQNREAYDFSSYRAQFELVQLLSNPQVEKEYLEDQEKTNLKSPIQSLGNTGKREVQVYSIHFLDTLLENEKDLHKDHHNLAQVVFSLIDTDKLSGKKTQSHFNALIAWRYVEPSNSPEARWKNWDGFEVTRYSKSPQTMEHVQ